ncbi:MAG: DNA polymerase III subunit gamma/tau [Sphingopyxis sp.]
MLGMDIPVATAVVAGAYRVLARKYRPQRFAELIGQDAMVQTLANAIRRDRLAHAFLMTGVRGVGKTSTARLIAKGLNCTGADGQGGPTIDPCGLCDACVAISEGRHIDVIEMDAASHTGVDDVREIIEAVRYSAVSARYKIYIIDEVHMLSKNAFNALLKTLEEPPAHVKFIFATTEVGKVPITVLSRCQRFDLRRITPDLLFAHFAAICEAEAVVAEDGALRLIAAAAEGSVRDGLSILDQAIAHAGLDGDGAVHEAQVREMLGLADSGASRRLFGHVLGGEAAAAIDEARAGYALGVEPIAMLRALLALAHMCAMTRVARGDDPSASADERAAVRAWAAQMGMAQLSRLWQLLLRAHDEVARAAAPFEALEMALLRLTHAATMPDPDALVRMLEAGQTGVAVPADVPVDANAAPLAQPASLPLETALETALDEAAKAAVVSEDTHSAHPPPALVAATLAIFPDAQILDNEANQPDRKSL